MKFEITQKERKECNLHIVDEKFIVCSNCDKTLCEIVIIQENEMKNHIYVSCPYCDDMSWLYMINGRFIIKPSEDLVMLQTEQGDSDIFFIIMGKK